MEMIPSVFFTVTLLPSGFRLNGVPLSVALSTIINMLSSANLFTVTCMALSGITWSINRLSFTYTLMSCPAKPSDRTISYRPS